MSDGLNCRPGDIARVVKPGPHWGTLVHVIEAAPVGVDFDLPGGHIQLPCPPGQWLVEVLGKRVPCLLKSGRYRLAKFGACSDSVLKPIRDPGDDAVDEIIQRIGKPDEVRTPVLIGQGEQA